MAIADTAARKLLHGGAGGTIAQVFAGDISFDVGGLLWQLVTGFFVNIFAALAGAAHLLVLPLEALWRCLVTTVADAAGTISFHVDGLWQFVKSFFPEIFAHLFAALVDEAHYLVLQLEAFWRWLQAAAAAALPFALGVAAVLVLVALVWFCGPTLYAVTLGVCEALVTAVSYFVQGVLAFATMNAPGAAGMLISCAAFVASSVLYFLILRAAGPVVPPTVF